MTNPNEHYATGKRKEAEARVYLRPGTGKLTVNDRPLEEYFPTSTLRNVVRQPLVLTETADKFHARINVGGGGVSGQAGAARHGLARALLKWNPELRKGLTQFGQNPLFKQLLRVGETASRVGLTMQQAMGLNVGQWGADQNETDRPISEILA